MKERDIQSHIRYIRSFFGALDKPEGETKIVQDGKLIGCLSDCYHYYARWYNARHAGRKVTERHLTVLQKAEAIVLFTTVRQGDK